MTKPDSPRIPCAYKAPLRRSVELPGGRWTSREWEEGEKVAYTALVLTRPAPQV
jgi:hypothetical protein